MFLNRLESIGFKSFAERIKIDFVEGVTAVVGPNGSGKSNVIDAVRWVLGEQSAKSLRGQKMEDIIFQGSDTRHPLNFAEVSIVLNNDQAELPIDYQEVSITRRAYRSGESEFLINKESCRLKDIIDLFTDTGLGRASFSIIGQGKIDEILSSKAEDRRAIFEEAAGVLKYKQRKRKAEFKLLDTKDNLDRVDDIIHEVQTQLKPLEKQAEKAKIYKKLSADLKHVEIAVLITEIEKAHEDWQGLLSSLETVKAEALEKTSKINTKEARVQAVRHQIKQLEVDIAQLQAAHLSIVQHIEQIEGERKVLATEMTHTKETSEKLASDKTRLNEQLEEVKKSYQANNHALKALEETLASINAQLNQVKERMNRSPKAIEAEIERYKSRYIDKLNEQAVLNNDSVRDEKQQTRLNEKTKTLLNEARTLKQIQDKQVEEKQSLEIEYQAVKKELVQIEANYQASDEAFHQLKESLDQMNSKLYEGNEVIAKLSSKIELLEDMRDNYQGFFFGVKSVLQAAKTKQISGIYGPVIDNIKIPVAYLEAMETVLGHQAQHIVTKDENSARQAITWLKKHQKGRATFLPLNVIQTKYVPQNILNGLNEIEGFIGIASQLIEVDQTYRGLADYLLGNVFVTTDLKSANLVAAQTKRHYRIVTLSGDVVFPGGSMSGGSKKQNKTSLFSREKELSEHREKLSTYQTRKDTFVKDMAQAQKCYETLALELEEKSQAMKKHQAALAPLENKLSQLTYEAKNTKQQLQMIEEDQKNHQDEGAQLKQQLNRYAQQKEEIQKALRDYENQIEQLTNEKEQQETNEKSHLETMHALSIEQAEHETRKKSFEDKCMENTGQINRLREEIKAIELAHASHPSKAEQEDKMYFLQKNLDESKEKQEKLENNIHDIQTKRQHLSQSIEDEENEIKGLKHRYEKLEKELQAKEVQSNRMDVKLESQLNYLQGQYKITFERAKKEYEPTSDIKTAKQAVDNLKTQIERLGTVNLGAIDEYQRLDERYQFLSVQRDDLENAKATLYDIIEEMDSEMEKRFSAVFRQIQEAFTQVFKHLFGGGFAELKLTDPNQLLETGIEIIAQPPGKKLKTLDLLSGGERALTAIALLFSILRVKPVPFCILDEVDAALDEANVERFGRYLKKFSKQTQFIVITHRKGTMEEADALYGITMQESGVSRLVSVKLEEADDLTESMQ